jgi:hypothetical protein
MAPVADLFSIVLVVAPPDAQGIRLAPRKPHQWAESGHALLIRNADDLCLHHPSAASDAALS